MLTVLLQVPLTRWADGVATSRRTVMLSGVPLVGSCLLFAAAEPGGPGIATIIAVLAMLTLTLGENLHAVAAFELSHRLAPEAAMGRYLGTFNLGWSTQLTLGPPFMTVIVLSGPAGWIALAAAFSVGAAAMTIGSGPVARGQ